MCVVLRWREEEGFRERKRRIDSRIGTRKGRSDARAPGGEGQKWVAKRVYDFMRNATSMLGDDDDNDTPATIVDKKTAAVVGGAVNGGAGRAGE